MLKDFCSIVDASGESFIGLKIVNQKPHIYFPHGFALSDDDKGVRRDILSLIAVLDKFSDNSSGDGLRTFAGNANSNFPINSYQYIIQDFLEHGYFKDTEHHFKEGVSGKINWKKTIQNIAPQVNKGNVFYLTFLLKENRIERDNLISKIHEYCVYESFLNLGWLYFGNDSIPPKPEIRLDKNKFLSTLRAAFDNTFNNEKQMLFSCMINIIQNIEEHDEQRAISFGVNKFEHVWEGLIDYVFGEDNKEKFFPHASWDVNRKMFRSSPLEPDTIMIHDGKLFVLDAKYYRYGVTKVPAHLPPTTSIQKQITYAEYADVNKLSPSGEIYNAFIIPYESSNEQHYEFASVGLVDWVNYNETTPHYKYVLGILADTKFLISTYVRKNENEINKLCELIESSVSSYRDESIIHHR